MFIADKIGLSENEKKLFVLMVEAEHSRSPKGKKRAEETLSEIKKEDGFGTLALESFKIISDWYHNVILELPKLEKFKADAKWISSRIGIDKAKVESALERLLDFGLLTHSEEENTLKRSNAHLATPSGIPSREIREHLPWYGRFDEDITLTYQSIQFVIAKNENTFFYETGTVAATAIIVTSELKYENQSLVCKSDLVCPFNTAPSIFHKSYGVKFNEDGRLTHAFAATNGKFVLNGKSIQYKKNDVLLLKWEKDKIVYFENIGNYYCQKSVR